MSLHLRPATIEDVHQIFVWRNEPSIVVLGKTKRSVTWDEHQAWFQDAITRDDRLIFVIEYEDKPVGQVRFDRLDEERCEVSIYLIQGQTGRGLGVRALQQASVKIFKTWTVRQILATIRKDNHASLSAFQKAGFQFERLALTNSPAYYYLSLRRPYLVPHNRLTFDAEEVQAVSATVSSGQWAGGARLAELEQKLAGYVNARYAIGLSSGLSALRLSLFGLGVQPGDEVIIPAYSCVALPTAVVAIGATAVPVDVRSADWNIDPNLVEQSITSRTRAIVAVNTFGAPAAIEELKHYGLPIVEDCAHGFGIYHSGSLLGNRADAAILSFYATKLMGAGEGGAVLTNDPNLADFLYSWRDYGDQLPDATRLNDKMNDLEASLALSQLSRLSDMIRARAELANRYDECLMPIVEATGLFRLPVPEQSRIWYRYVIEPCNVHSSVIIRHLQRLGVHAESPITNWLAVKSKTYPIADHAYERLVSLPMYPTLSYEEQDIVCNGLAHALQEVCHV